jgi:hypothetical protein
MTSSIDLDDVYAVPDDPSPEAQWREIAASLREMADRAEAGDYRWLHVAAQPVNSDDGREDDVVVFGHDVQELADYLIGEAAHLTDTLAEVS